MDDLVVVEIILPSGEMHAFMVARPDGKHPSGFRNIRNSATFADTMCNLMAYTTKSRSELMKIEFLNLN
jgi:hypothetical protein